MTTTAPEAGAVIHWLASGFSFMANESMASGQVSKRGLNVVVTAELKSANSDRDGISFLDLTPEQQIEKFGEQIWDFGYFPFELTAAQPGTIEFDLARDEARQVAWSIADPAERQQALAVLYERYGREQSKQISSYSPGDDERNRQLQSEGRR